MKYYFDKIIPAGFDEAKVLTVEALKKEGFGVITEIDMKEKLKEKLGVDFRRYIILGACHPQTAYKAISVEDKIGIMLPCNVILQELENGHTEVAAVDPQASMMAVSNNALGSLAGDIREKLKRVIDSI